MDGLANPQTPLVYKKQFFFQRLARGSTADIASD